MHPLQRSIQAHAIRLGLGSEDTTELKRITKSHCSRLSKISGAAAAGENQKLEVQLNHFFNSAASKVVAIARTIKRKASDAPISLTDLKQLAGRLDAFNPVKESVRVELEPKGNGTFRPICTFGQKRRALQTLCTDALSAIFPAFKFDFLEKGNGGMVAAICHLLDQIKGGHHEYLVTTRCTALLRVPKARRRG